jgi:hypothetical protein
MIILVSSYHFHRETFHRSTHIEKNENSVNRRYYLVLTRDPTENYASQFVKRYYSVVSSAVNMWDLMLMSVHRYASQFVKRYHSVLSSEVNM